jgi:isoleucyl-tRNA synthetase
LPKLLVDRVTYWLMKILVEWNLTKQKTWGIACYIFMKKMCEFILVCRIHMSCTFLQCSILDRRWFAWFDTEIKACKGSSRQTSKQQRFWKAAEITDKELSS